MSAIGPGTRVHHEQFGVGAIVKISHVGYGITFMQHGYMEVPFDTELEVIDTVAPATDMVSLKDVEKVLYNLLQQHNGIETVIPLANKWVGGKLVIQPGSDDLKPKEIPIDAFFHKIVMVRDRLRVMEQRINSSKNMSDEEKVNLQQYITRIYGSLTTFNVLFKNSSDQFKGTGR